MSLPLIIVPVYNAPDALQRCLAGLDRHCSDAQPILLIDDASTDPAIAPLIESFCDRPARSSRRHANNRGFVATANEGFAAGSKDVVLLNSDAIVTVGWMEAMIRCAASDRDIATVTPWSNNAEICSFPELCRNNPVPANADALAQAIALVGGARYPELPTGVGFCMLITRTALDRIGHFDEATFGRGYGEENDFCRRAVTAGLRNVLCDDAYVVHLGGASFAGTGLEPGPEAMQRLLGKHPDYERVVHAFIAEDPLATRRRSLLDAIEPQLVEPAVIEPDLQFTGERFHPDCVREMWYEHFHRYVMARELATGRAVLDLACGEGYGSALLAQVADRVTGIDRSASAIAHAASTYSRANLTFACGDATRIPLPDDSIDLVVSFETLEHLEPQDEMLAEFDRVLRADGVLLISSPDKRTYSDERDYRNEFHVRELYRAEFEQLLRRYFSELRLFGQKLAFQSLIWDVARDRGGYRQQLYDRDSGVLEQQSWDPLYWIAVCARNAAVVDQLPLADLWSFGDADESVYAHYEHEIRKNMQAGQLLAERDEEIDRLRRRVAELEEKRSPGLLARLTGGKNR